MDTEKISAWPLRRERRHRAMVRALSSYQKEEMANQKAFEGKTIEELKAAKEAEKV